MKIAVFMARIYLLTGLGRVSSPFLVCMCHRLLNTFLIYQEIRDWVCSFTPFYSSLCNCINDFFSSSMPKNHIFYPKIWPKYARSVNAHIVVLFIVK